MKNRNVVRFSMPGNIEDFEEKDVILDDIHVSGNMILFNKNLLGVTPGEMTYSSIEKKIIKSRYTNDDQIAIMLNKDNSDEDMMYYNEMQGWRDFAREIARVGEIFSDVDIN